MNMVNDLLKYVRDKKEKSYGDISAFRAYCDIETKIVYEIHKQSENKPLT